MPNHCYQQVTFSGTLDLMREIHQELFKSSKEGYEPQLLQLILPMPFKMNKYTEDENGNFNAGWYDWRVDNWGTKWDAADIDGVESSFDKLPKTITGIEEENSWVSYNCWTAWGPPIPVWQAMHDLGIEVDADYQDEGGMFEGTWVNGVDDSWSPEEGEDIDDE